MAVKIRLSRHGGKKSPFYHVVVADGRAPRDGRFIELIGHYDPRPAPSLVDINKEKAQEWLAKGAQPSQSARKLLEIAGLLEPEARKKKGARAAAAGQRAKAAAAKAGEIKAAEAKAERKASPKAEAEAAVEPAAEPEQAEPAAEPVEPEAEPVEPETQPATEAGAGDEEAGGAGEGSQ